MSEDVKEQTQIFQVQLHVIDGEYKREPVDNPVTEFDERFIYPNEQFPYHDTNILTPEMGWVPITPTFATEVKKRGSKKDSQGTDPMTLARTAYENHRYKTLQQLLRKGIKAEMRLVAFNQSEVISITDCGSGVMIHR